MTIQSENDLKALEKIGKIVSAARDEMIQAVRPGITTKELDMIGKRVLSDFGAKSAPKLEYNFPGYTCISINDQAAHGIPGSREVKSGDIVNIDVSAELNGYFADTGATVAMDEADSEKKRLCGCSNDALRKGIENAKAGTALNQIGKAIHLEAARNGFTVIKNLGGHGIGRRLHEDPSGILNYFSSRNSQVLNRGLVLAIETFLSNGGEYVREDRDGWTLKTPHKKMVAQFEHTIIVTDGEPVILTI